MQSLADSQGYWGRAHESKSSVWFWYRCSEELGCGSWRRDVTLLSRAWPSGPLLSHISGKRGESLLPCPAFSLCQFSGRWYVLSLGAGVATDAAPGIWQEDFRNRKGVLAQGSLHLKFLGMASYGGKCNKPLGSLKQWSAKCGPWTSSTGMTWELVRNADSQALPQIY